MMAFRALAIVAALLLLSIPVGLASTVDVGLVRANARGLPPSDHIPIGFQCDGVGASYSCAGDPLTRGWVWASTCASDEDVVCSDFTGTLRVRVDGPSSRDMMVEATFVGGWSVLRGMQTLDDRLCDPLTIEVVPAQARAPPRDGDVVSTGLGPSAAAWHVWVEESSASCGP